MAGWRLSGCRVSALPALLSLLQLLLTLGPATPGITCPPPTSVEHADIQVKSYKVSSRERYTCNSGFKRKAGTSSLTECVFNKTMNVAHWTIPNLKCISTYSYNSGAVTVCLDIMEEEAKGMSLSLDSKCSVTSLAQGPPFSLELGVCRCDSHSEETGRGIMKAKLQLKSSGLFQ